MDIYWKQKQEEQQKAESKWSWTRWISQILNNSKISLRVAYLHILFLRIFEPYCGRKQYSDIAIIILNSLFSNVCQKARNF